MENWKQSLEHFFYDRAMGVAGVPSLLDHCLVSAKDPRLAAQPDFHVDLVESLINQMALGPDSNVLEVGCASGYIACGLAPKVSRYTGVDLAAPPILVARRMKLPNARFQQADGGQLPFPDEAFDAAFVCDVFSNFPTFADAEALLDELVRVVRPGGRAMAASITDADKADEFQKRVYAVAEELSARFGPQPLVATPPASGGGLIARLKRSFKGVPQPPKAEALIINYNFKRSAFDEFARNRGLGVTFFDVHSLNPYLGYRFNVVLTKS